MLVTEYGMLIAEAWAADGDGAHEVLNPATGRVLARVHRLDGMTPARPSM
jgi:hypothetical protein